MVLSPQEAKSRLESELVAVSRALKRVEEVCFGVCLCPVRNSRRPCVWPLPHAHERRHTQAGGQAVP